MNGEVRVDETGDVSSSGAMPDYLQVYLTEGGFDFPQLIQDDYFDAIHLLWNNRKYMSCLKLVFSAIETLGYVEYGPDRNDCFAKWLDDYCDLGKVGVTSDELWELRNSLVHMTNLDSRKVRSGKTHRLLPQFTHPDRDVPRREVRNRRTTERDRELAAVVQPRAGEVRRVRRTLRHHRFGSAVCVDVPR